MSGPETPHTGETPPKTPETRPPVETTPPSPASKEKREKAEKAEKERGEAAAAERLAAATKPADRATGEAPAEKKPEEQEPPSKMQEMFNKTREFFTKITSWLAEQGTEALQFIAQFLRSIKWEGLAKLVEMLAGSDRAALKEALTANGVKLVEPVPHPERGEEDPQYKAQLAHFKVVSRQLAARCKMLGYGNSKVDFYNRVMAELIPGRPEYTIDDLWIAAQRVERNPNPAPAPSAAPGTAPATPEELAKLPTLDQVVSSGTDLMAPVNMKITDGGAEKKVTVQIQPDTVSVNTAKYKVFPQLEAELKETMEKRLNAKADTATLRFKKARFEAGKLAMEADIAFKTNDGREGSWPVAADKLPAMPADKFSEVLTKSLKNETFMTADSKLRFEKQTT